MATPATVIKTETLRDINRSQIIRFVIPSTSPSQTSATFNVPVASREGRLQVCRIDSVSGDNFDFVVRVRESAIPFSVEEILRIANIDAIGYQETDLNIFYSNDDELTDGQEETPNLYVVVINNGVSATGVVTAEFVIESMD